MELAVFPPYVAEVTKEPAADTEGRLGEITQGFLLDFLLLDIHGIGQPWTFSSLKPYMPWTQR